MPFSIQNVAGNVCVESQVVEQQHTQNVMILEGPIATTVTIVNNNSQSQKNAKKLYNMLLKYNWPCSIIEDQLSCCLTFWGHDERAAWRAPQKARYIHFLPVSILFNHQLTKNKSTSKPHRFITAEKKRKIPLRKS